MDNTSFEQRLNVLVEEISSFPSFDAGKTFLVKKRSCNTNPDIKSRLLNVQDSLDYLSVSIKYILFDLEVTRRENGNLKKLLEKRNQ